MSAEGFGISASYVAAYRASTAPLHKNIWNRLDEEFFNGKWSLVITFGAILCFIGGIYLQTVNTLFGFVGLGIFFAVYFFSSEAARRKAKPAEWLKTSMVDFLEMLDLSEPPDTKSAIEAAIRASVSQIRASYPNTEFVVEFMTKKKSPTTNIVLWACPSPFESTKKEAVLLLQEGKPYAAPIM